MDSSLPTPSKDNEWLGFCPSAVKLQNGDKKTSLKRRTEYQDSYATSGLHTFKCAEKGCAFMAHVSVDFVWKVVMKAESLGLQCRWAFLAKSHTQQPVVTGRQYQFQCPICIFQYGHCENRIWGGVELFLDHVSTHRGKSIAVEVLRKLNIINDHICTEKEDFDLNLFPSGFNSKDEGGSSSESMGSLALSRTQTQGSVVEKRGRNASLFPASLMRSHTHSHIRDRADSVVETVASREEENTEPGAQVESWSAGLSEFHADKEGDYLSADF